MDDPDVVLRVHATRRSPTRAPSGAAAAWATSGPLRTGAPGPYPSPARRPARPSDRLPHAERGEDGQEGGANHDVVGACAILSFRSRAASIHSAACGGDRVAARPRAAALLVALLVFAAPAALEAHDIPVDVAIQAFVKPEGRHLRVLVRAPLDAMRDVDYPRRGADGLVDVARADAALREAASVWLAESLRIDEGDRRLPAAGDRGRPDFACRPTARLQTMTRRWRSSPARACPTTRRSTGRRGCSTSCSTTRSSRIGRASPSTRRSAAWACTSSRRSGFCRRAARCARSSTRAIPGSCGSIRAGTRPRSASSSSASSTSSTARTTCCSFSAS